jgi:CheY-like chemotaxis protein
MSKKVLIVEDEQLVAYLMENYVTENSCCEVIASVDNGDEAIEIAKKEKPDFILMDVRIEGDKDGIETALAINKEQNIPIIFTSGNTDDKTTERAKETNIAAFLVKPVKKEELRKLICPENIVNS